MAHATSTSWHAYRVRFQNFCTLETLDEFYEEWTWRLIEGTDFSQFRGRH